MKALLLLSIWGMTAFLLAALRRVASPWKMDRDSFELNPLISFAKILPVLVLAYFAFAFSLQNSPWSFSVLLRSVDHFERYRFFLCEIPPSIQGFIGLGLILLLSVSTFFLLFETLPKDRRWLPILAILAWIGFYQILPFHLSAIDFDDFFVIDKLNGVIEPDWENDKRYFTIYDYMYRVTDLLGFLSADPFLRFAVNGWFHVLALINIFLMVSRVLARKARESLGRWGTGAALILLLGYLGPFLLSHALHYELASAVVFLLSFNLIERWRCSDRSKEVSTSLILGWCAFGLWFQSFSHNQTNFMWLGLFIHAALSLHQLGAFKTDWPLWLLIFLASLILFFMDNSYAFSDLQHGDWLPKLWGVIGVIALGGGGALIWFLYAGRMARWLKSPEPGDTAFLILVLYLVVTALLFALPNQAKIGIPFQFTKTRWEWGTNHARYSILFYPFASVLFGHLLFRLKIGRSVQLLLIGFLAILWNQSYLWGFYLSDYPDGSQEDTGTVFQRNMRPYEALAQTPSSAIPRPLYYLPLPRDHGDHYLLRAVDPHAAYTSLCQCDPRSSEGRILVSRHTLSVIRKEKGPLEVFRSLPPGEFRNLNQSDWEIQFIPMNEVNPAGLDEWCHSFSRLDFSGTPAHPPTTPLEKAAERNDPEPEPKSRWIIPPGRETIISSVFETENERLPFRVGDIRVARDRLHIEIFDQKEENREEVVALFTGDWRDENGCENVLGLLLCHDGTSEVRPSATEMYGLWLRSQDGIEGKWAAIWEAPLDPVVETAASPSQPEGGREPTAQFHSPSSHLIYVIMPWLGFLAFVFGRKGLRPPTNGFRPKIAERIGLIGVSLMAGVGLIWLVSPGLDLLKSLF